MDIKISKYILTPKHPLNRFTVLEHSGVLFQIDNNHFVDYFPWEQFGDLSVDELLDQIVVNGGELPSFLNQCVNLDKERYEIDYWDFLNHELYQNTSPIESSIIKIKYINDFHQINEILRSSKARLRIDFNNGGSLDSIVEWWKTLTPSQKLKVDYLEDPIEYNHEKYLELKKCGIKLACDRNNFDDRTFDFKVIKPNVDLVDGPSHEGIFSSYMGHDLGRFHSFLSLMKWGNLNLAHGINTPNIYNEQLNLFTNKGLHTSLSPLEVKRMYERIRGREWKTLM
jgi:hypothetical protein